MTDSAYGLWALVAFNSMLFIIFAASFFHPRSRRDWRALGAFSAFIVALFTEMYGYPLTVYLLTGPLSGLVPGVDLSHNSGHLWNDLIGWKGDAHFSPFHLASYAFIIGGFVLIASGWRHLYAAQRDHRLATTGPYAHIRHPQYAGFITIMIGFLLQWPTLATLIMFPVLALVYRQLRNQRRTRHRGASRCSLDRLRGPHAEVHPPASPSTGNTAQRFDDPSLAHSAGRAPRPRHRP